MASSSPSPTSSSNDNDNDNGDVVKFLPFASTVDSPFWVQYCHMKLETIQLSEAPISVRASVGIGSTNTGSNSRLQCQESSLLQQAASNHDFDFQVPNDRVAYNGTLVGCNTLESFQKTNKNKWLKDQFLPNFCSSEKDPVDSLTNFFVLTFADLKNHKVLYWFAFPALLTKTPIRASLINTNRNMIAETEDDHDDDYDWYATLDQKFHTLRQQCLLPKSESNSKPNFNGLPPFFVFLKSSTSSDNNNSQTSKIQLLSKNCLDELNAPIEDVVFGFVDPSSSSFNTNASALPPMGWPLRNLIAYLSIHLGLGGTTVTIVSYRPSLKVLRRLTATSASEPLPEYENHNHNHNQDSGHDSIHGDSLILRVAIPPKEDYCYGDSESGNATTDTNTNTNTTHQQQQQQQQQQHNNYKVVGWELNARLKPGPRSVNLRPLLDPTHLAIQAADLNLKLMKWRMIPSLQVEMLQKSTKVLLIGAGTLGCSVARTLLGWGIRNFTILDYGTVSYSNPVRQNLFTLEDCHFNQGAGKPKAQAVVDALQTIAADVNAEAIQLSIPMPGHASETKESIESSVTTLDRLIQECDVVYLLTDTRESRWLPTLMAAAHDKIMINAALGLDSWLVMRHGGGVVDLDSSSLAPSLLESSEDQSQSQSQSQKEPPSRLGCYFCNDVVAPENSTKNRTLDQQCTVTRPGLAPIASSMAVELMVSMLHHPDKQRAPAPKRQSGHSNYSPTTADDGSASALGVMPHQIRGSLVSYTMMTPTVPAFPYCTGCSASTIKAYHQDKLGLVHRACQSTDGSFLEDLSGITAFRADAADKMAEMEDWDDDEDDGLM